MPRTSGALSVRGIAKPLYGAVSVIVRSDASAGGDVVHAWTYAVHI